MKETSTNDSDSNIYEILQLIYSTVIFMNVKFYCNIYEDDYYIVKYENYKETTKILTTSGCWLGMTIGRSNVLQMQVTLGLVSPCCISW